MGSSPDRLTPLQRALLAAFFSHTQQFFLTGGAALAGFYLHHRATDDLDFFTHEREAFDLGTNTLTAAADDVGATLELVRDAPGFRRALVRRGDEAVVVVLVWERVASAYPSKVERDGVRVDRAEEILANELTTLVSRAEERDLVDVMFLERSGLRVESALDAAFAKDGGCTPGALAFVLSDIRVPDTAALPAGVTPAELTAYLEGLIVRLRRLALPRPPPL